MSEAREGWFGSERMKKTLAGLWASLAFLVLFLMVPLIAYNPGAGRDLGFLWLKLKDDYFLLSLYYLPFGSLYFFGFNVLFLLFDEGHIPDRVGFRRMWSWLFRWFSFLVFFTLPLFLVYAVIFLSLVVIHSIVSTFKVLGDLSSTKE